MPNRGRRDLPALGLGQPRATCVGRPLSRAESRAVDRIVDRFVEGARDVDDPDLIEVVRERADAALVEIIAAKRGR